MRIISWNIQWGRGADGRVDLGRMLSTLRDMGDADVICLQEVAENVAGLAGGQCEDEVAIVSEALPEYEVVFGPAVDVPAPAGGRARFGNLLLSRLPLGQVYRHLLPYPADPSVPSMQRGCIEAVVMSASGPVRVLTTHLEYYSAPQRRAQIGALRALQQEAYSHADNGVGDGDEANPVFATWPRPQSAVVCGDFNCEPASDDYALMAQPASVRGAGWLDAWPLARGREAHAATVGLHNAEWPDRGYCCDFFWVSEDLAHRVASVAVNAETAASDHQPVLLTLRD